MGDKARWAVRGVWIRSGVMLKTMDSPALFNIDALEPVCGVGEEQAVTSSVESSIARQPRVSCLMSIEDIEYPCSVLIDEETIPRETCRARRGIRLG